MDWLIIAVVFGAAAYLVYRSRKNKKGGSYSDHKGNNGPQR